MSLHVLADPTYALALAMASAELTTKRLVDYRNNIRCQFGLSREIGIQNLRVERQGVRTVRD